MKITKFILDLASRPNFFWTKSYGGRGTISFGTLESGQPILEYRAAYNIGDEAPPPTHYLVEF